ncbi:MAG: YjbE family putative metal transport protein, partial [Bacillota bacterium]
LENKQRKQAAILGAGGAIILRVIFTSLATTLMRFPYVNAIGGVILLWITWKLIKNQEGEGNVKASNKFWGAVVAIVVADLSMAFDNVMGVAGAAHGNISLVIFGLMLSVPILILGSNWLAIWMKRQPFIIYIGAAVLAHTSISMIVHDKALEIGQTVGPTWAVLIPWILAMPVLVWGWFEAARIKSSAEAVAATNDHSS